MMNKWKYQRYYQVFPGKLYFGSYPFHKHSAVANILLDTVLKEQVTVFVDLTEPGEKDSEQDDLVPYFPNLPNGVRYISIPFSDSLKFQLADIHFATDIIEYLIFNKNERVYTHCRGGLYRSTIIACYLVKKKSEDLSEAINSIFILQEKDTRFSPPYFYNIDHVRDLVISYQSEVSK